MSPEKVPYLYVAGASFSGSTLLAFLLNAHPQMASVSEVAGVVPHGPITADFIDSYTCSCGKPLLECPFYRELEARIEAAGSTFDLRDWKTHFRVSRSRLIDVPLARNLGSGTAERIRDRLAPLFPGYRSAVDEVARRNLHFAQATLELTGKRVFVDAQKDPARVRFLGEMDSLDLRVIHLVRDARGGASSYMKNYPEKNDAATAARKWQSVNMAADRARRHVPAERWMRVRYDELCADHTAVLDRIADFAGADRAPIPENFYDTEHHIVGNRMRLGRRTGISRDESWKERLSESDLETIGRIAGRANRYFGFDWPTA